MPSVPSQRPAPAPAPSIAPSSAPEPSPADSLDPFASAGSFGGAASGGDEFFEDADDGLSLGAADTGAFASVSDFEPPSDENAVQFSLDSLRSVSPRSETKEEEAEEEGAATAPHSLSSFASAPEGAAPRGGLFSRLRGLFGRRGPRAPELRLTARIARETDDELLLRLDWDQRDFQWAPAQHVTLTLADGATIEASVIEGTTPAGHMTTAMDVYLRLRWLGSLSRVVEARFTDANGRLVSIEIK